MRVSEVEILSAWPCLFSDLNCYGSEVIPEYRSRVLGESPESIRKIYHPEIALWRSEALGRFMSI